MLTISISKETFARVQAHAVPLVDTFETVLNRALDALEANSDGAKYAEPTIRAFNPGSPPSLSFTTVRSVVIEGKRCMPNEAYWNTILINMIKLAASRGLSPEKINDLIIVNSVVGKKDDGGYKYVPEAGVSVQGQDANSAWKAAFYVASEIKASVNVTFSWQDTPKAAHPGVYGTLSV